MTALDRLQKIDRSQNIDCQNVRLYFWSRSGKVLSLFALVMLGLAVGLAWFFGDRSGAGAFGPLAEELAGAQPNFDVVLRDLGEGRRRSLLESFTAPVAGWIEKSKLNPDEKAVAKAEWESLGAIFPQANADLLYYAHYVKPLRRANELVGDFHAAEKRWDDAQRYYERELKLDPAPSTRAKLVELQLARHDLAALRRLTADPAFTDALTPPAQLTVAAAERRWGGMFAWAFRVECAAIRGEPLLLAGIAGLVWFIIALQAIQPADAPRFRTLAPLLALVAGAASTIPTLAASAWQEEAFGLRQGQGFFENLNFFVAGVGPREELLKLLFFLPFVPVLLRRGSELEMLIVAACVGLGFAVAENLLYFAQVGPVAAYGRFLTANFLHMAATGLVGLAFCRMLLHPAGGLAVFGVTLALVALAHGVYDAFIAVRAVRLFAVISTSALMALSFAFFQQLRARRHSLTDQFSLASTLVLGLSLLTGIMLFFASRELGLVLALLSLAASVLMLWIFAAMLHWQLGEGLAAVSHEAATPHRYS